MNIIIAFLQWLFGIKPVVADAVKTQEAGTPRPDVQVVAPVIKTGGTRPYMTQAMIALLAAIRSAEAGKAGYNADFRNDDKWVLTNKTFDQFRGLARSQVTQGEASSALGGYQFITTTLDSLKASLHLTGNEIMNPAMQDDLAVALMIRRGYMEYMAGRMNPSTFCNNLAKEWASLPVVTSIQGAHRALKVGQSYYAGDGLNKALHTASEIISLVSALKG